MSFVFVIRSKKKNQYQEKKLIPTSSVLAMIELHKFIVSIFKQLH